MVNVSYQRRMAAEILKCGVNRVWIDPDQLDEVAEAVTRGDVRRLISYRVIQVRQKAGISRGRARAVQLQRLKGRRRGHGSRSGTKNARSPRKREWIRTIRPLRAELRRLRGAGELDPRTYRTYYRKARGSTFKSRAHLISHLESAGVIGEKSEKAAGPKRSAKADKASRRKKAEEARASVRRKAEAAKAIQKAKEEEAKKAAEKEPEVLEDTPMDDVDSEEV